MKIVCLWFTIIGALSSYAVQDNHQQLAQELVNTINVDHQVDMIMDKLTRLFEEKIGEINATLGQNNEKTAQNRSKRYVDTVVALFRTEVKRQHIAGAYVKAYSEIYTTEELQALLKFYQSPIGKNIADKNKILLFREVEIMQKINDAMMPVLKGKAEELLKGMLMPAASQKSEK
jgi:hypothetical protein